MMAKLWEFIVKLLGIGFIALFVIVCLFFAQFLLITLYAEVSAQSLAPPEYPNSELIEKWQSGGPESKWDRRTYRTTDSVDEVLLFMEEHMPGFTKKDDPKGKIVYQNYAINTNWLAQRAAEYACTSLFCIEKSALTYPGVSVTFYPDPDNPTGTLIKVWISWPAP